MIPYLILLAGFLIGQAPSPLEDPPLGDPSALELARNALEAEDMDARRQAAAGLLQHCLDAVPETLPAAECAVFFMDFGGAGGFSFSLRPYWSGLREKWPGAGDAVAAALTDPAAGPARVAGAAAAAGCLRLTHPAAMSALGALLARPGDLSAAARAALRSITGRSFTDRPSFELWWEANQDRSREDWLEDLAREREAAIRQRDQALDEQVRALLQVQPAAAWRLAGHDLPGVRREAYQRLRDKPPDPAGQEAQTLEARLQYEDLPELRQILVGLIPLYFEDEQGVLLLKESLRRPEPGEQTEAARALPRLADAAEAARLLLESLEYAYPPDRPEPRGDAATRRALLVSLQALGAEADAARVMGLLERALEQEQERAARDGVFQAAGAVTGLDFAGSLLPYLEEQRPKADRIAALTALTGIAQRALQAAGPPGPADEITDPRLREFIASVNAKIGSEDPDFHYQVIRSAAALGRAEGGRKLVEQLLDENPDWIRLEILDALAGLSLVSQTAADPGLPVAPDPFLRLLEYQPPKPPQDGAAGGNGEAGGLTASLGSAYFAALRFQVGGDLGRLESAVRVLLQRGEEDAAFALASAARPEQDAPERLARWRPLYAETGLRKVLSNGVESPYSEEVAGVLAALMEQEPKDWRWPAWLARLEYHRGRLEPAVQALAALGRTEASLPAEEWTGLLEVAEAALDEGRGEAVEALRQVGGEPGAADRRRLQSLLERLPAPEAPPSSPEGAGEGAPDGSEGPSEAEEPGSGSGDEPPPATVEPLRRPMQGFAGQPPRAPSAGSGSVLPAAAEGAILPPPMTRGRAAGSSSGS